MPEELVKVGLFSTYATLFASFCYLGLDQAYVRFFREPPGGATRSGLLTFCTVTSVGVSVLVALGMTVWWQGLSAQDGAAGYAEIARKDDPALFPALVDEHFDPCRA